MASKTRASSDPDRKRLAAERAAEARRRIAADQRRRRMITVAGAVGAVLVVIAVFVAVKVVSGGNTPKSGAKAAPAPAAVTSGLATVPASVFDTVGLGDARAAPQPTLGAPLTQDGKPRVLFVGAEWCPICAGERWALAVALERFGTFTGLQEVSSSPSDSFPNTASISFSGATYTSPYLALTAKELESNQASGDGYRPLDTISGSDKALFTSKSKGYPFIDLGGSSIINTVQYDPGVLKGKTQAQIAAALTQPKSPIAEGIIGSANLITAELCSLTGKAPAAVCSSTAVRTATAALPGS